MPRKYLIWNLLLFLLSSFLLILSINSQLKGEFIFLNESVAMLFFCLSFPLKIYNIRLGLYLILVVLLILLFSPLNYSFTIADGDTSVTHSGTKFTSLISPVTFFILMLFLAFNYSAVKNLCQIFTKGTDEEKNKASTREIEFYYDKFSGCSDSELDAIFKMQDDYPMEAQLALKRIKEEKGIT